MSCLLNVLYLNFLHINSLFRISKNVHKLENKILSNKEDRYFLILRPN